MNWKSLALISTSLAALSFSATAAFAAPPPPTMGSIEYGVTQWWDTHDYGGSSSYDYNWVSLTGRAKVNMPYSQSTNIQVELFGDSSLDTGSHDYTASGVGVGNFGGGIHLNWRDPNEGLIGVFGSAGRVQDLYGWSAPAFTAGFEAQYYWDNWTVGGQAGYMDADGDYVFLWNGGFVRALATYYPSSRFKLSGGLAYIAGDSGYTNGGTFTESATAWAWQAEGRYWFGKSVPIAGWIRYEGRQEETHYSTTYKLTSNQVYVGFSWMFGGEDLKQADREGASVELPNYDWFRLAID